MRAVRSRKPQGKGSPAGRKSRNGGSPLPASIRKGMFADMTSAIADAIGEGIVLLNMAGKILWANPAFLNMSGYSRNDIVGRKGMDLISKMVGKEEIPYFTEALRHALKGKILPAVEFTMISKKGREIPVLTTVSTVGEKNGHPPAIISVFKDITERKKAEGIIKESEKRYRALFEESRDAIYITSRNGAFIKFNESMLSLFGYSREEMTVLNAKVLYANPADRRRFQKEIEEKGFVKDYELRLRRKDGRQLVCLLTTTVQSDGKGGVAGYQGVIRDITEKREAEMEMREMTARFEYILGATRTHIDVIDESFTLRYVDPGWQKVYGEPKGKKCYDYFMGRDTACPTCGIPRALRTHKITVTEEVLPREGNRVIQVHSIPFKNERGEWLVAEFNIDITEYKKAQNALQASESQYRTTIDSMGDPMHVVDTNLRFLLVNRAFIEWNEELGLQTDALGRTVFEVFPFLPEKVHEEYAHVFRKGEILITEDSTIVGGKEIITETRKIPIVEDGKIDRIVTVIRDITERKKAEMALKESEEMFRTLADQSPNMIFINTKGKVVYANRACENFTGYSRKEFYSPDFNIVKLIAPEYWNTIEAAYGRHMKGEDVEPYEYTLVAKDGRKYDVINASKLIKYGGETAILGVVTDITDRKRAEREIKENEARLAEAQRIAHIGSWEWNIVDDRETWSDETYRIFGAKPGEFGATYGMFLGMVHEEDRRIVQEAVEAALRGARPYSIDHRIVIPDGTERFVHEQAEVIYDENGAPLKMTGTIQDVTERRQAEEALQSSHDRLLTILDGLDADIYVADMETYEILFLNRHMRESFGDDLVGQICWQVFRRGSEPCPHCSNARLIDAEGNPTAVFIWEGKNPLTGRWYTNYDRAIRWIDGRMVRLQIAADTTERKRVEEALRLSEERYRNFVEQSVEGIWLLSFEPPISLDMPVEEQVRLIYARGFIVECNDALAQMYGYASNKDMIGKRLLDLHGGQPSEVNYQSTLQLAHNGYRMANRLTEEVNRKGERIFFLNNAVGIIQEGNLVGLWGTQRDITEQRRAEEALLESERKYRELIDHSLVGNYITQSHIIKFCNRRFAEIFGYSSPEDLIGKNVRELIAPESWELVDRQVRRRESGEVDEAQYEFKGKRKDGRILDLEVLGIRIIYEGKPAIQGTMIDISERKRAEEKLAAIHEMTGELSLTLEATEIAQITMDIVQDVLEFENCSFSLVDEKKRELCVMAYRGFTSEPEHMRLPLSGGGVTVWVANHSQSVMLLDVKKDPRYVEWMPNMKSELAVPMKVKEKTIGIINVESEVTNAFVEKDRLLLETIASASAVAIQNARLHEEKLRRIEEMTVLDLAFHDIMSNMDLKVRLRLVVDWATKLLSGKGGGLYLYDDLSDDLELVVSHNLGHDFTGTHISPHEGLAGKIFATKIPMIIDDYTSWEGRSEKFGDGEFHSTVGVPIIWKSDVIGILTVVAGESERKFTVHDMHLLENFANTTAVMIINARLFDETRKAHAQLEFVTDLMSHDLSNINQIALGNMEILADTDLRENQGRFLTAARNAVRRSAGLVSNFKVLQKIITQKEEKVKTELSSSIERAVKNASGYPGKVVSIEFSPASGQLVYTSSHLSKAFENLLDNAIKFTPQQHVRVEVDVTEDEGGYTVRIRDWGKGVSGQMKEEIFQRYENLQEGKLGTGLGLYASKKIVENHGGRIWATGNPEGGSIFCVYIPKAITMLK